MSPLRLIAALAVALLSPAAVAAPLQVVAAENFWGEVAKAVGGAAVQVTSVLSSPDQDPHMFEASVETARAVADARLLVINGVDYDPWMEKLAAASPRPGRRSIVVGDLVGRKSGDNPHIWYDPDLVKTAARRIAGDLGALDPAHGADYQKREAAFEASLQPVEVKLAEMRRRFAGVAVTASEPVFGYQAARIGLDVRNAGFALSVMNGTEPSAADVAAFEADLTERRVKAMIFNAQASEPSVERLVELAKANGVPVVGVSETEPPGESYVSWMLGQLDALERALAGGPRVRP